MRGFQDLGYCEEVRGVSGRMWNCEEERGVSEEVRGVSRGCK